MTKEERMAQMRLQFDQNIHALDVMLEDHVSMLQSSGYAAAEYCREGREISSSLAASKADWKE